MLRAYLGSETEHFLHELNAFARSPFDMLTWDRYVQYGQAEAQPREETGSAAEAVSDRDEDSI